MPPATYWCHSCAKEITPLMVPHPLCPDCQNDFVEEIDPTDDPRAFAQASSGSMRLGEEESEDEEIARILGISRTGPGNSNLDPNPPPLSSQSTSQQQQQQQQSNPVRNSLMSLISSLFSQNAATQTSSSANTSSQPSGTTQSNAYPGTAAPPTEDNALPRRTSSTTIAARLFSAPLNSVGTDPSSVTNTQSRIYVYNSADGWRSYTGAAPQSNNTNTSTGANGGAETTEGVSTGAPPPPPPPRQEPGMEFAQLIAMLLNPELAANNNAGGGSGTGPAAVDPVMQLLFHLGLVQGNPGDYVHDQRVLDDVITRLMEQTQPANRGISEKAVDRLPLIPVPDQETECAVCKDAFTASETMIRQLPCGHLYHDECIRPWLTRQATCPVCRLQVAEN